jgi:hypothetical protein
MYFNEHSIDNNAEALSIDNNDLVSVIKVNLGYFELRKTILNGEFLLIIPLEFLLFR